MVFDYRMEIRTIDVFEPIQTKWDALLFRSGFVGGHCIGVDPYKGCQSVLRDEMSLNYWSL